MLFEYFSYKDLPQLQLLVWSEVIHLQGGDTNGSKKSEKPYDHKFSMWSRSAWEKG